MKPHKIVTLSLALTLSFFKPFVSPIKAENASDCAIVRELKGAAHYSSGNGAWFPLKAKTNLQPGMLIKTAPESTVLLQWEKSSGVLKVNSESMISLVKFNVTDTHLETITETEVALLRGSVTGSQKKSSTSSRFKITSEHGSAFVDGSDYHITADGSISIFRGAALLASPNSHKKISAGQAFSASNQSFGSAVSVAALPDLASAAPVQIAQRKERPLSPNGNNGVGNGEDPAPPGEPRPNDGTGTSPGKPGNGRPSRP